MNQGNTESAISSTKQENYPGSYELNLCIISCFVELLKLDECSEKLTYTNVGRNLKKYTHDISKNEKISLLEPILIYLNGKCIQSTILVLQANLTFNKEKAQIAFSICIHFSTSQELRIWEMKLNTTSRANQPWQKFCNIFQQFVFMMLNQTNYLIVSYLKYTALTLEAEMWLSSFPI